MEQWESELKAALLDAKDAKSVDEASGEVGRMRRKLEAVADILADAGIIASTQYAKRKWIEG
jgi:predicted transcriptional regulator